MNVMTVLLTALHARLGRREERGQVTLESLALAALAIVALIAIFAAVKTYGTDLVQWIRDQTIGS